MASISLTLDKRKKTPIIKLLVNVGQRNAMISLNIPLDSVDQWMPSHPHGPVVNHPSARSINALCKARLAMSHEVLHLMMINQEEITLDSLKGRIIARIAPDKAELTKPKDTFVEWLHAYQMRSTGRTRELYRETEKRLNEFAIFHTTGVDSRNPKQVHKNPKCHEMGDRYLDNLMIQEITPQWLEEFESFLARTMGTNARAIHLRNVRAAIKHAIKNDVDIKDPFVKFAIKREETRHRALTPEQFKMLFTYPIPDKEKELKEYRDIAWLVFCLIGINVADLFEATGIVNGRLEYNRRKTKRPYSIKVEPEAMAIIERYKGKEHLLKYADTNISHISLTKKLDKALKRIGPIEYVPTNTRNHQPMKVWHGLFPDISVYWLRHTWATFAAKIGISKDTISRCLGHGKRTVTDIYIDYDLDLIDDANRKVIDFARNLINC